MKEVGSAVGNIGDRAIDAEGAIGAIYIDEEPLRHDPASTACDGNPCARRLEDLCPNLLDRLSLVFVVKLRRCHTATPHVPGGRE